MASQSDQDQHHQPQKEPGQASDSSHPQPENHYSSTGYPPAMGYPPTMGYPPGQHQQGYPPPPGSHGYYCPYAQAPPAAYYSHNQMHHHQHQHQHQQEGHQASGFARGVIIGIMFLVLLMCITSLVLWIALRPEIPAFDVESFSVSNFNASSPTFTANWDANVTVRNTNSKLVADFLQIQNFLYYDDDDLLASSLSQPFSTGTKTETVVPTRLSANSTGGQNSIVGNDVVDQLAKDRSTGTVSFSLRMVFWTRFKNSWWTRHVSLRVYCENIKVAFVGGTGNANLANGLKDCIVLG